MQSSDTPPGGGDFRSWLHFYKWGRSETVTFRKRAPHLRGLEPGDVLFFVLDGFLIGDARVAAVRNNVYVEGSGALQEIDIAEGDIWEYLRPWSLWDTCLDKLRLAFFKGDVVPPEYAIDWLQTYREGGILGTEGAFGVSPKMKGRVAVYKPGEAPPFFGIKKK